MAKHAKEGIAVGWKIAAAIVSSIAVLALVCVVLSYGGVLDIVSSWFNDTPAAAPTAPSSTTSTTVTTTPPVVPVYRKPEQLKGVWLTPGKDYYLSSKNSAETVKKQIDSAFEAVDEWAFNTLLLPLDVVDSERVIYPSSVCESASLTDKEGAVFDPVAYLLSKAKEKNLYTYIVLDLHVPDGEAYDPRTEEGSAHILSMVDEVTSQYKTADGFFVSGFAFDLHQITADERETAVKSLTSLMTKVTAAIQKVNPNFYVGLLSHGIWAHHSVDERGSDTGEYYEEFTDGCADTLSWLEQGLFQCVMVQNYTSTAHPTASFQKVLTWWDSVSQKLKLPLYISHYSNRIGSYLAGWKSTDQLAQQYLYCKSAAAWQGSCYDSLSALQKDKLGVAEALKRAYDGTLDENFIYKKLTISFPTKTSYTTTESSITLQGAGDKNFPLLVNGKEMELTDRGYFSLNCSLEVGENTFVFSHKGTTKTYTVIYKRMILQEVSPSIDMEIDGGNQFIISAIAHKGSTVTATINKETIKLIENEIKLDESGNTPSDFSEYKGIYTIPKGVIGQAQDLGAIVIKASYNGLSETKNGGKLSVKALPVPTTTTTTTTTTAPTTQTTTGTATGTTNTDSAEIGSPIPAPTDPAQIVTIQSEYAETFSGGTLVDDYSRPYNSYLPKGTTDYLVNRVYYVSGKTVYNYFLLASGRRVYEKDATLTEGGVLTDTKLVDGGVTVTATHSEFCFSTTTHIPVYIRTRGQTYLKDSTTETPDYGLEKYSQTTTAIDITFYYLSEQPALPDVSQSPLFSSAKWVYDETQKAYTLQLTLKKTGGFYGVSTKWVDNQLKITFLNPADISQNSATEKLKGISILLDPGHGSDTDKPWEAPYNLSYANTLKTKLEALGATVDMTRTGPLGTQELSLQQRVAMSQTKGYHLVISVHMNGFDGTATGASVHYYSDVSYIPSKIIYDKMHAVEVTDPYFVGTETNGRPRSSGTVWGTLYMTRSIFHCPSVLLECAFLDNAKDKEALSDPVYRDKLMQAVTDGVVDYFSNM